MCYVEKKKKKSASYAGVLEQEMSGVICFQKEEALGKRKKKNSLVVVSVSSDHTRRAAIRILN